MSHFTYRHTMLASYVGYITQAIINNLAPLLFLTFQREFAVSLERIGLLITVNFSVQILVDFLATKWMDRIGYRVGITAAHAFATAGLLGMGVLPYLLPDPYVGLVAATVLNAIGGGLIEVLISPIVESLPGDAKASAMSLLHSFYCWGQVGVVLLSTLYFALAGTANWRFLPMLWALVPLGNFLVFCRVPLRPLVEEGKQVPLSNLLKQGMFWLLLALMMCAGASELAMSQWSSLFAESGLGVSKTVGDLLGPCAFAVLMGLSRVFFGVKGEQLDLEKALMLSGGLCVASYLLAVFAPHPLLSLLGCALCGLSVGLMWPGVFSISARVFPNGGTAMFALLALAGDVGCTSGPGLVGFLSPLLSQAGAGFFGPEASGLKMGLLVSVAFPAALALGIVLLRRMRALHWK